MILKYLKQSYPLVESQWKMIIYISLFVGLFIIVFQPFGMAGYTGPYKYLLLGGYGLVTFLVLLFNHYLVRWMFPRFLNEKSWTVWKELIFLLWNLFTIGLANLFYTSLFFNFSFSLNSILTVQFFTLAIGIIPIIMITVLKQNYLNRRHRLSADQLSESISSRKNSTGDSSLVRFSSDTGKEEIEILISDLLAVDAEGNYITVFFFENEKPRSVLLRNTLSYAEEIVAGHPVIFKCHRSFLVNLDRILKVSGNSLGYDLVVQGVKDEIPVSRNNIARFKELLSINNEE